MKPHRKDVLNVRFPALAGVALALSGIFLLPSKDLAQNVTMSNGGSTATLNLGGGTGNIGMNSWTVLGGQNQLDQQWFWYSVNGAPQQSIDNISAATVYNYSIPASPIDDLGVVYQNSQLSVEIEYLLTGNGVSSGSADIMEYLSVVNKGASPISLSFYQYSNFNLFQNNMNSVNISGGPGAYNGAVQTTSGAGSDGIAEVIDAPYADFAEAATTFQTLNQLNSGSYYDLNDTTAAGPGDVTWAFEWTATLQPFGTVDQYGNHLDTLDITKDKGLSIQIVPEPSTAAFIGMGLSVLGLMLRRRAS